MNESDENAASRGSDGMTESDSTSADVDLIVADAQNVHVC
jgi:hypothetical protein